jgi:putative acetyltransferase
VDVIKPVYDEYSFTWDEADYHADLYDLRGYYFDAGHHFWIGEDLSGEPVGTVALELFDSVPGESHQLVTHDGVIRISGCDCALQRLYVKPGGRKGGLGTALLEKTIQEAKDQGRQCMEIWSDKRFVDAHRLYGKLGAVVVGDRICHDPDQSPEWGLYIDLR